MSTPPGPLVVIGLGNVLLADDAVGVRVVDSLRTIAEDGPGALPAGTRLVDGGTLGMELLAAVHGARGLVIVDATRIGVPVGTVSILHEDAIVSAGGTRGERSLGAVGELIAAARIMGWLPEPVCMVGIEVAQVELGLGLTPLVDRALPAAVESVRVELRGMDERPVTAIPGGGATARMAGATA